MKRISINIIAAFAVICGLAVGAVGSGLLALLSAFALVWGGGITLIEQNTDWITHYGGE